jgi:hypothetical protein
MDELFSEQNPPQNFKYLLKLPFGVFESPKKKTNVKSIPIAKFGKRLKAFPPHTQPYAVTEEYVKNDFPPYTTCSTSSTFFIVNLRHSI